MENSVRDLMKMGGVTLQDVATKTGEQTSTVCRALNDSLTMKIKSAAKILIAERQAAISKELANG